ncbi:DUF732 domain-containing protein [Mycobacterium intracellulare]|uniref:DUF732 domain-containing protein n=1 Tax=Mycobacterium intracellulare subsp. chimaera TaxID=222805 RepID=A0A7U5MMH9_MYCIT|nr:DUF732 domain-containing protein [Mycobacterium intracellulare]ASL16268.1 hypothetical protein MYCOZU2_03894 [Mycobacterium intracellulare subsp. chimaera]ASQ87351.1 hypothetical protein CE197_18515 [Mycobacterium intracellulare subsp. chimaera]MCF1816007.1 DUF732 domain-containing protein [Mycobacterium intracellulare subsp. intracellulare]MDM3929570.1 DUF732 domain-containing protein [Mycobacterium intracellulare subsp. chimaera]MDS0337909.1 DUF732 domain-containing protein [Mycobacterium
MTKVLFVLVGFGAFLIDVASSQALAEPNEILTSDEAKFVNDLAAINITPLPGHSNYDMVLDGWALCGQAASGKSQIAIADQLFKTATKQGPGGISRAQADSIVKLAIKDLCPPGSKSKGPGAVV